MKIGLVGDYDETVTAHRAIPVAIKLAARDLSQSFPVQWIQSEDITTLLLKELAGVWCVPASPYRDMEKVLQAIHFARIANVPFLGTCGGYQHAALEFARNHLGFVNAGNAEVDPHCEMPVVSALACKLVEVSQRIFFDADSIIADIYQATSASEEYRCSYGVNRDYLSIFEGSAMRFTGFDADGDPRALEIADHRFFVATAFQPERAALKDRSHPIVASFLSAVINGGKA
ncbi:MAG: hypothetical protein OEN02_16340 [Gammaproteobacteria bacterium]|nr:hypothetical protein [Gammaproteobacteria bacterium]MDH3535144.1 hypothetical protein [Gammaproteobacteria bacterium]